MKVRWTSEAVRFRITPTELAALEAGGEVAEQVAIPGNGGWRASIGVAGGPTHLTPGHGLRLVLGRDAVAALADPDAEGVYFTLGEPPIRYLVEKDFPCAHPHPVEAAEAETERFAPTPSYLARKRG